MSLLAERSPGTLTGSQVQRGSQVDENLKSIFASTFFATSRPQRSSLRSSQVAFPQSFLKITGNEILKYAFTIELIGSNNQITNDF